MVQTVNVFTYKKLYLQFPEHRSACVSVVRCAVETQQFKGELLFLFSSFICIKLEDKDIELFLLSSDE